MSELLQKEKLVPSADVAEIAAKFNMTLAKPDLKENFAQTYLTHHREVGALLVAVLVAEDERIQQYRAIYEADREARKDMSEAELKMLPAAKQPISKEETYAPGHRVFQLVKKQTRMTDGPLRSALEAGLLTDVLSYNSSGDSRVIGYRIPEERRLEVISLLSKWGSPES